MGVSLRQGCFSAHKVVIPRKSIRAACRAQHGDVLVGHTVDSG